MYLNCVFLRQKIYQMQNIKQFRYHLKILILISKKYGADNTNVLL